MAAASRPCARWRPAANRRGSATVTDPRASSSARAARLSKAVSTPWSGTARLLAEDLAVPARVVKAGPGLGDGAPDHRVERPRLGRRPEVDVEDDGEHEQDERHVVQEDGQLPQHPGELEGGPNE